MPLLQYSGQAKSRSAAAAAIVIVVVVVLANCLCVGLQISTSFPVGKRARTSLTGLENVLRRNACTKILI